MIHVRMALFRHLALIATLKGLCLPLAMDVNDIDRLDEIIQRGRPIQSGEHFTGLEIPLLQFMLFVLAQLKPI